ncbi:hypothetical protein [Marilutibacter alkalisoli]|uniref:Uncharacterized protein n=1 Tax=Marilutibacter alkalisoli TaxID=2591633 RepID=A0A514BQE6_9GAMM|nr:hypothetical protein [Lysobacter alkalisoli]QDH69576.1 hypothetical protein FKV23_05320 [Lysobacter alkalisoli]
MQQGDDSWAFFVRTPDDAPGRRAMELREATLKLAGDAARTPTWVDASAAPRRGPSWPWLIAWLASIAVLWWLERWRRGVGLA